MQAATSSQKAVLLVIEDDRDVREAIASVLADEGFEAVEAGNGREGLDRLRALDPPPCMILLDLMMPVMNGWQFLDQLGADAALARIPVVVMTAMTNAEQHLTHTTAACLKKPYHIDDLLTLVDRYCC